MSRHSRFVIGLGDEDREKLEALLRRRTAEQRMVLRARIVLAAAQGEENVRRAARGGAGPAGDRQASAGESSASPQARLATCPVDPACVRSEHLAIEGAEQLRLVSRPSGRLRGSGP